MTQRINMNEKLWDVKPQANKQNKKQNKTNSSDRQLSCTNFGIFSSGEEI